MNKPIRVLMLVPNLRISNGVTTFAMNYFSRLDPAEVRIDFALYRDVATPVYDVIRERGSQYFILPPLKKISQHLQACRKILREGHYDIVHDNSLFITLPMMRCARKEKVPVRILHSHNAKLTAKPAREPLYKLLLPLLRRQANSYIACSELAGQAMFPAKSYQLLANVIDMNRFAFSGAVREQVRHEMNAADKLVVGTVARMSAQKNPSFALKCFDLLADRRPDAEYWWIGSGNRKDASAESLMAGMRHADRVKLLGSRSDVPQLYQGMDALLMPSLFEGLPLVALEAEASGLPCLLSDTITREVDVAGLIEYKALSDGPEAWSQALEALLTKGSDREDAFETMSASRFSDLQAGKQLTDMYRKMLEQTRG